MGHKRGYYTYKMLAAVLYILDNMQSSDEWNSPVATKNLQF